MWRGSPVVTTYGYFQKSPTMFQQNGESGNCFNHRMTASPYINNFSPSYCKVTLTATKYYSGFFNTFAYLIWQAKAAGIGCRGRCHGQRCSSSSSSSRGRDRLHVLCQLCWLRHHISTDKDKFANPTLAHSEQSGMFCCSRWTSHLLLDQYILICGS